MKKRVRRGPRFSRNGGGYIANPVPRNYSRSLPSHSGSCAPPLLNASLRRPTGGPPARPHSRLVRAGPPRSRSPRGRPPDSERTLQQRRSRRSQRNYGRRAPHPRARHGHRLRGQFRAAVCISRHSAPERPSSRGQGHRHRPHARCGVRRAQQRHHRGQGGSWKTGQVARTAANFSTNGSASSRGLTPNLAG